MVILTDNTGGHTVALQPFTVDDVADYYVQWLNDPEIMKFTEANSGNHTLQSARDYVANAVADPRTRFWKIIEDRRHVGNIRLSGINQTHRRCEVALIVGEKSVWGGGVGSTAIRLASDYALTELGLRKLSALIYANNDRSVRAFSRAGFVEEARLISHFVCDGGLVDGIWMCRIAREA